MGAKGLGIRKLGCGLACGGICTIIHTAASGPSVNPDRESTLTWSLVPGFWFLFLGSWFLVLSPRSSLLTPHSSLLPPQSSLLTPPSSVLPPQSSLLSPPSSVLRSSVSRLLFLNLSLNLGLVLGSWFLVPGSWFLVLTPRPSLLRPQSPVRRSTLTLTSALTLTLTLTLAFPLPSYWSRRHTDHGHARRNQLRHAGTAPDHRIIADGQRRFSRSVKNHRTGAHEHATPHADAAVNAERFCHTPCKAETS